LVSTGAGVLRLELKKETAGYVGKVTQLYRREIDRFLCNPQGYQPDQANLTEMKGLRPEGFTKGHYFRGVV
ncbi:MAG: U32 family peptidase, partial [Peptococcaceae bacterium]|nr:U32 family peptidase [Peptococcaceae bacterium]